MEDGNRILHEPPAETAALKLGNWIAQPGDDPIIRYLTESLWEAPGPPEKWEVARRSQSVYVYRELSTGWRVVAKYYIVKTGDSAEKHARRELASIEQARRASLSTGPIRALRPFGVWGGILFLEFVAGLTLEDVIAVRRSRPGSVSASLGSVARLLAHLHGKQAADPEGESAADITAEARKMVDNLARYGVLQDNPIVCEGLLRQISRWAEKAAFNNYMPALSHGDATTTNFILPDQGDELVAIDWERSGYADPAADLGRIMAEVEHSITQHGGNLEEAVPLLEHLADVYAGAVPPPVDVEALLERARYQRAVTSLRIARNGWLSRLERTRLVAQAQALLV